MLPVDKVWEEGKMLNEFDNLIKATLGRVWICQMPYGFFSLLKENMNEQNWVKGRTCPGTSTNWIESLFKCIYTLRKEFFYSKSLSTYMKYRLGKWSSDVKISERNEVPSVFYDKSSLRILKEVSISH